MNVTLKGDKLLLMMRFWIFVLPLLLVCLQVSFASKSERSLTETAKDGSKSELKTATGGGKIAKKHKHKKGKHKHKKSKKSKTPKISDGDIESTVKGKSSEKEKSSKKEKSTKKEKSKKKKSKKSTETSESSESCGSCSWGEWSEGECTEV